MGEIADMMIDGELCEGCGVYLENEDTPGYPMYCSVSCAQNRGISKAALPYLVVGYNEPERAEDPKNK